MAFALIAMAVTFNACNDDDENPVPSQPKVGNLTTHFDLRWDPANGIDYNPGDKFVTASGDSLIINEVRMWISNVKLYNNGELKWTDAESFYLVEKTASNEREMIMFDDVPVGEYDRIEFGVGVDSAHNQELDQQEGELDENGGMAWNWNIGYKFFVHNGMYYDSDSMSYQPLRMHMGLDTYYTTYQLDLPSTLTVEKGGDHEIHLMTMNGKTYNAPNAINVQAERGNLQAFFPGTLFDNIQQNYSNMFMIHHVE